MAQRAKVPMKTAERTVSTSGGVYPEGEDMLVVLPPDPLWADDEGEFTTG
jgi:hypothetical protein